jgi:hypothetical protein
MEECNNYYKALITYTEEGYNNTKEKYEKCDDNCVMLEQTLELLSQRIKNYKMAQKGCDEIKNIDIKICQNERK